MHRISWLVPAVTLSLAGSLSFAAEEKQSKESEKQALAKDVKTVKVSLVKGLSASEAEGKPISAKFEIEDGKLQLSVYTAKDGKFYEVIVDHQTGKVSKTQPITSGGDLTAAEAQNNAMAKSKISLRSAVGQALKANKGYLAVSATPSLEGGQSAAEVTLVKGNEWKTVKRKLD
jgi:peptidase YpeB-like protein